MIPKVEDICSCYHESDRYKPFASGVCYGTKEQDPCTCKGDTNECDFYNKKKGKSEVSKNYILNMSSKDEVTITPIVDIHKIIDDAMEKKDRAVHILILPTSTSVNVTPYKGGNPRWINKDVLGYECPECHAMFNWPTLYCPNCGATLARPEREDANGKDDYIPPKRP